MAAGDGKGLFSFNVTTSKGKLRKEQVTKKKSVFKHEFSIKNEDNKDYILAADESGLESVNKQEKGKELVIPMIKNNKWRFDDEKATDTDKEAADEILNELRNEAIKTKQEGTLTIPLLMQNRLPGVNELQTDDEVYAKDVKLRPSESTMEDYERVPITSFGKAMLRGMDWKEGQPIGLTNKGLSEPVEYIPRFKGLGLGAERRQEEMPSRKRKLGESKEDPAKRYNPIVEKDGRVRHVKGIDEKVQKRPKGYEPGGLTRIEKGSHKGLHGKIVAVDEDNARVTIILAINKEMVTISQYQVSIIDEEEYKRQAKAPRGTSDGEGRHSNHKIKVERLEEREERSSSSAKMSSKPKRTSNETSDRERSWLAPGIRVRIISDKYKKGKYYNKKVNILDVVSHNTCTCTDDRKILEGLRVADLETVVPKSDNAYVLVVDGKYKGQIAKILERNQSKCRATIQLLADKHVTKTSYDDISEFIGDLPDELFVV